jgi:hypothetical protein
MLGDAVDQAYETYDQAKAQDPRIEEAFRDIDDAQNTLVFALALNVAAKLEAFHAMGPYRLDWVATGRRNLVRLTAEHYDESPEQAEERVKVVEKEFSEKLGKTLIVWMAAIPTTEKEDVLSMFVHMIVGLGLPDPREAETAPDDGPPEEDELTRLALLYQNGLITEDEYRLLLKDKLIEP